MPASISSPKLTIKDLVKTEWVAANVLDITPDFHTGFLNPGGAQYQVCFVGTTENATGESGYDAMSEEGPVSRRQGTLPVMCFGRRAATGSEGAINPKKFVELAAREVERIVHEAFVSVADFEYMSVMSSTEIPPDGKHEPPYFGWTVTVTYEWRKTLS